MLSKIIAINLIFASASIGHAANIPQDVKACLNLQIQINGFKNSYIYYQKSAIVSADSAAFDPSENYIALEAAKENLKQARTKFHANHCGAILFFFGQ
ncbi:MAG: hypothetical protein V4736_14340 [Bdellovibrionota bacterium]